MENAFKKQLYTFILQLLGQCSDLNPFQIKSIRKIKDQDGHKEADNFRPVQDRNDRIVTFSFAHMTRP